MLVIRLYVYTVAAFGLAYAVGHARISLRAREWLFSRGRFGRFLVDLAECPACFGFWEGWVAGALVSGALGYGYSSRAAWGLATLAGVYTLGANFILGRVTGLIAHPREN